MNDSIETLLLRHYGSSAQAPAALEQQLIHSVRQEAQQLRRQQGVARRMRSYRINRRKAIHLVAIGSAGLGLLGVAMEGLQAFEMALLGQDATQSALP
jgi:hypothetical protein